ncbi:MAG: N-acetylornithine carbamoyltransferase [Planctomycetes bacterium]|nr:N-acetylornithine carbamoyltransferase [Planctomycetota bacterium]
MSKRDFLSAADLSRAELDDLLDLAARAKGKRPGQVLAGKTLGLLFFEPSLRTRVSFEVAMVQLGGHCINLSRDDLYELEPQEQAVMDGAAEEHVKDAARTLSRYVDALGIRAASRTGGWDKDRQELLVRSYARHASVPVINLETCFEHPCQAIADVMTMRENLVSMRGRKLTLLWCNHPEPKSLGPTHSVLQLAAMMGMQVTLAHPLGFEVDDQVLQRSKGLAAEAGGSVQVVNDLRSAAPGAEVLYARSWASTKYWDDPEREAMVKRSLQGWRVDAALMASTNQAFLMHPLPVRRNVVATDEVLDGPRSVIYDQAANRTHVQKALLMQLLKQGPA